LERSKRLRTRYANEVGRIIEAAQLKYGQIMLEDEILDNSDQQFPPAV